MINKKLLSVLGLATISIGMLVGCTNDKDNQVDNTQEETQQESVDLKNDTIGNILLNYNEDGMKILKANYPEQEKMELALRNIGHQLSDLKLKDINGKDVKLNQFNGKKVMIEILQDSCEYCMTNTPIVHKYLEDKDDIVLVSIFLNSTVDGIKEYYEGLNIKLPENVWLDENKDIVDEFNLTQTPTAIFVDESGKISLVREDVYDNVRLNDDFKLAFESDKIYDMTVNKDVDKIENTQSVESN